MRLRPASLAASSKLANVRSTGRPATRKPGDADVKPTLAPKTLVSTAAAAPLKVLWPETYSGNGGVMSNEVQAGSATVAALPSLSACRMAVIGRQKSDENLASQATIAASARATLSCANSRALSATLLPCCCATVSAI